MTQVFLIAGEPSGDRLGGALMAGLRQLEPDLRVSGIGGAEMKAQGLQSLFPMEELSVMGLAEVLPKYRHLKRRIAETTTAVLEAEPDVLLTIDSPDFCLRVAKGVRRKRPDIRVCHYVAPSVWAWRPGRAKKMAKVVDHVLALLPFEPPYMEAEGMRCDFVGHPVVAEPQADAADAATIRLLYGIPPEAPLVLALPGSRKGEVARLAPRFGQTMELVLKARPDARIVVPTVPGVAEVVRDELRNWPGSPILIDPRGQGTELAAQRKRAAFAASTVALAASGTVSLELAAANTPMVIAYDVNWLTRQIARRMLRIDTYTLVNLVTETRTVPEFVAEACRPELIAPALLEVMENPSHQRAAMAETMVRLGKGGEAPGLRAARAVLAGLGHPTALKA